jgi:hypothetical protein
MKLNRIDYFYSSPTAGNLNKFGQYSIMYIYNYVYMHACSAFPLSLKLECTYMQFFQNMFT